MKDTQSNKYQLTINNPDKCGYTHKKIKSILFNKFITVRFVCMADEEGSCFHTHIFIYFASRVRFSMIKKYFPEAHIETVKGTVTDNINYIKKSGKWEDDKKHGTQIPNTYEEWGIRPPDSMGYHDDMSELFQMILDGCSNMEIISYNQDYILNIDKLDRLRTIVLTEKYKNKIRLNLEVTYVYGETGAGKTRDILQEYGNENVYRVTDYQHPFDGYSCQPIIMFDEFRSSLRLQEMLNYLDIYPLELPARYTNKFACYEKVFVVSNWNLLKQYPETQQDNIESWNALLRRIHKVKTYLNGTVTTYTLRDYLITHNIPLPAFLVGTSAPLQVSKTELSEIFGEVKEVKTEKGADNDKKQHKSRKKGA